MKNRQVGLCVCLWAALAGAETIPSNGPFAGGNSVLATNVATAIGDGGDVTNVTVGGVSAVQILGQGTNWVEFVAPATGSAGTKDVVIQSASAGDTTLAGEYAVNLAGQIGGEPDWSRWADVAGLPTDRYRLKLGTLGDRLYAVGGSDPDGKGVTNVYCFDGANWTEVAGLPAKRWGVVLGEVGGALIAAAGAPDGAEPTTNAFRFDGTAWEEVAGVPAAYWDMRGATYNGALYVVGGSYYGSRTNVYRFDGTNWTEVAGLPAPNESMGVAAHGGHLYAVGGENATAGQQYYTNAYRFDGTAWEEVAGLPVSRSGLGAFSAGGSLYVAGGEIRTNSGFHPMTIRYTNAYRFDGTGWTEVAGLPRQWSDLGAASMGGVGYMAGGLDRATNVYRFPAAAGATGVDPGTGIWTGGFEVAIGGTNLGNGADITNVTLCGVEATILGQSATQVVVAAGAAAVAGTGDVRVFSTSFGETAKANGFEYLRAEQAALAFGPASPQAEGTTRALSVTGGSGTGAVSFAVAAGPGQIAGGTNLVATAGTGTITVVATKAQDDLYFAASSTATVAAAYAADVYLLDLRQIYDGTAKQASATTMPAGLAVQFTYDGSATAPTATGTYAVVGTVDDGAYLGAAAGTLEIVASWDYGKQDLGGGWWRLGWFGDYAPMGGEGWVWHNKHGFMCVAETATMEDLWLFTADMGWLWTAAGKYPFLFRNDDAAWLWYNGQVDPRWFFNFGTEEWEEMP